MIEPRTVANIPSSDRTDPGRVTVEARGLTFRLRCTVPCCGWRRTSARWASAQQEAFSHAGQHQFGGMRE